MLAHLRYCSSNGVRIQTGLTAVSTEHRAPFPPPPGRAAASHRVRVM